MKIGILIDKGSLELVDCSKIEKGNPGMGGSEYLFLLLAYYLSGKNKEFSIILLVKNKLNVEFLCEQRIIDEELALENLKGLDCLIANPCGKPVGFFELLDQWNKNVIAWVHNYIPYMTLKHLANCQSIKKVVFVGKQHYESYCDDPVFKKSTYIYNMVRPFEVKYVLPSQKKNIVTYVGALVPAKGFHKLARQWKKILKKVPDAKLWVIGSGKLYDKRNKMGKYGISFSEYEKNFIKYLLDDNGKLLKSVHFYGTLGYEKEEILQMTKVGVTNPTGISETFCLSAVEFEGIGIPVVAYKGFGFLDTVQDKNTGLLSKTGYGLYRDIVRLLKNNELNFRFGQKGIELWNQKFSPKVIIPQWEYLFRHLDEDKKESKITTELWDDLKWLKLLNRYIHHCFHFDGYSVSYVISVFKSMAKNILKLN